MSEGWEGPIQLSTFHPDCSQLSPKKVETFFQTVAYLVSGLCDVHPVVG